MAREHQITLVVDGGQQARRFCVLTFTPDGSIILVPNGKAATYHYGQRSLQNDKYSYVGQQFAAKAPHLSIHPDGNVFARVDQNPVSRGRRPVTPPSEALRRPAGVQVIRLPRERAPAVALR